MEQRNCLRRPTRTTRGRRGAPTANGAAAHHAALQQQHSTRLLPCSRQAGHNTARAQAASCQRAAPPPPPPPPRHPSPDSLPAACGPAPQAAATRQLLLPGRQRQRVARRGAARPVAARPVRGVWQRVGGACLLAAPLHVPTPAMPHTHHRPPPPPNPGSWAPPGPTARGCRMRCCRPSWSCRARAACLTCGTARRRCPRGSSRCRGGAQAGGAGRAHIGQLGLLRRCCSACRARVPLAAAPAGACTYMRVPQAWPSCAYPPTPLPPARSTLPNPAEVNWPQEPFKSKFMVGTAGGHRAVCSDCSCDAQLRARLREAPRAGRHWHCTAHHAMPHPATPRTTVLAAGLTTPHRRPSRTWRCRASRAATPPSSTRS